MQDIFDYQPTQKELNDFIKHKNGYVPHGTIKAEKKKASGNAFLKEKIGFIDGDKKKPKYKILMYNSIGLVKYEYNKYIKANPMCKHSLVVEIEYK